MTFLENVTVILELWEANPRIKLLPFGHIPKKGGSTGSKYYKTILQRVYKQGQGNQCQTPGVKFEKETGRNGLINNMKRTQTVRKGKKYENTPNRKKKWLILKETGRNRK